MEENTETIIGLSVLSFSAVLQMMCLLLMRVLVKLKHGGHVSTLRTWLYFASALEQISFISFHVKYHFFNTDLEESDTCIVLRFIQSVCSTFTSMWLLVITCFYFMLTVKPEKCFTFHSRFLSHCVTWTWPCVSCLLYLVLAFLIKEKQHFDYVDTCWTDISNTVHMYITYGNEIIPLFVSCIFISCARFRIPKRIIHLERFMMHSECSFTISGLLRGIDRYLVLLSYTIVYYIVLTFRFLLVGTGSDVLLMGFQASRGISISLLTCLLDEDVLAFLKGKKRQMVTNGFDARRPKGSLLEMQTFTFHGHQ